MDEVYEFARICQFRALEIPFIEPAVVGVNPKSEQQLCDQWAGDGIFEFGILRNQQLRQLFHPRQLCHCVELSYLAHYTALPSQTAASLLSTNAA
jgi:hypothetical protein